MDGVITKRKCIRCGVESVHTLVSNLGYRICRSSCDMTEEGEFDIANEKRKKILKDVKASASDGHSKTISQINDEMIDVLIRKASKRGLKYGFMFCIFAIVLITYLILGLIWL